MAIAKILKQLAASNAGRATLISIPVTLATAVVAFVLYGANRSSASSESSSDHAVKVGSPLVASEQEPCESATPLINIPQDKIQAFRLDTQPPRCGSWPRRIQVTGRIELNESRVAHINSLVEGVVREICVELGDEVQEGQVLLYIDSREVGEAKLKLVRDRLALASAKKAYERQKTIHQNTTLLLGSLDAGKTPQEIEEQFRERPIGSYREQLVSALVRSRRAAADYQRIRSLAENEVIPQKEMIRAKAEHESSEASYRAVIEQIRFDGERQAVAAEQRLQEAEAAVAISRSQLLILGYSPDDIDAMDPIAEHGRVAYYPVRAPLTGTVIARPAPLSSHVDATTDLMEIADLSNLWLRADVFEKDLAAVKDLKGTSVTFATTGYPGRQFAAQVFTVGQLVDNQTRAARLLAIADNSERLLKPGMFVEIELCSGEDQAVLQVPASAIQRHNDETFVFVQRAPEWFECRQVKTKRSTSETVEIVDGLTPDDPVVVSGGFALKSEMLSELMAEE